MRLLLTKQRPEAVFNGPRMLLLKAHVSGYTRKDGAVVAAHEDSRHPAKIAERIIRLARDLGYSTSLDTSKLSNSHYVQLSASDEHHPNAENMDLKLRISDHNLPPSYGDPGDIDVHAGEAREESVGWGHAVAEIAKRAQKPTPALASREISRLQTIATKKRESEMAESRRRAESNALHDQNKAKAAAAFPEEWTAAQSLPGKERREVERVLRARLRAME